MKKLFSKLMLVAIAVAAFTACEDVPEPYDVPGTGKNEPGNNTEIEGGTGEGTLDAPYNAIAALNYGNKLASGEESPNYRYIKGKVVSVKEEFNTQYGNGTFYISEDGSAGNQFYAYRVLYLGNKRFTANDVQIEVGDSVIVCGIITNYNGTVETAQGKGFLYELNGVNRGGEPQEGMESKPTGDGTLENPYNAAAAVAKAKEVGENESADVYIKGKVVNVTEQYSTQYGNATFTISDDGTNAGTTFTIFRALYLGNKKYTSGDLLAEGNDVIIYGKITNFKGNTPETVQGKAFLYSLNGKSEGGGGEQGEAKGTGTQEDPFNSVAANNEAAKLAKGAVSDKAYYIKGKVSRIAADKNGNAQNFDFGTYGNATFYISDDGTEAGEFYCYRVLYLENAKWEQGAGPALKENDEVIVCAKLTNYNGTYETAQNEGYLYSLNGKTKREGTSPQPGGEAKGTGTLEDPFNSVAAAAAATALGKGNVSTQAYYIKGKVASIATDKNGNAQNFDFGTYGNASFYISDDGTEAGQFYCYRVLYLENAKWEQGAGPVLKVGDEVIVCAKLTLYNTTPETAQNEGYVYSLNGTVKRNGDNPGPGPSEGGSGTLADPYTPASAHAIGVELGKGNTSTEAYYIKGKVASIATDKNGNAQNFDFGTYGNASFYISADGGESGQFYCYRVLYLENAKWEQGAGPVLKVGDEVIVYSKITNYNDTPETVQNEGYVYSLNGKTKRETGGGEQGGGQGGGEQGGAGSYSQPYNVAAVIANGTSNTVSGVYVKGYIVGWIDGQVLASGAQFNGNAGVKTNILLADNASETDVTKCVPVQLPNNAVRTGLNLQDNSQYYGKEVLLYGNLEKYFGAAGVKGVTYAECGGNSIGSKP